MSWLNGLPVRELDPGYSVAVDRLDETSWCQIIGRFEDANIYQTWTYDEVRCGRSNISHLLLKRAGEVVAAAQSRIVKVPLVKAGIAYVRWGPLWRRTDETADPEIFRQAIRALRYEYCHKRGLVLRLYPVLFQESGSGFASILAEEGFGKSAGRPDRTLVLDTGKPIEELRSGLRPHWRRYLKVAEKNGLEIIEGSDDALFESFVGIYKEMVGRKKFSEPNDIREFRMIQRHLPEHLKMKILLCKAGGKLCAGLICSAVGKTGIYLFGATSNEGLKARGSYLLHWKLIEWLQQNGITNYDLHGINPETNPGTYKFKADLCGNNGSDLHFLGRFDTYSSVLSHSCVTIGDALRARYQELRKKMAERAERQEARGAACPEVANAQTE
jgi:hypothetical protein